MVSLYNSVITTWSLSYLGNSFHHPLPWDQCPLVKNITVSGEERERQGQKSQGRQGQQGARAKGEEVKSRGRHQVRSYLSAWVPPDLSCLGTVSHQYFWYHTTLSASNHIEEGVKALVLNLSLGIFAVWFLVFLIMMTGLKMSTQVSHPDC